MGIKLRFVQAPASWSDTLSDLAKFDSRMTLRVDKWVGGGHYIKDVKDLVFQVINICSAKKAVIDQLNISGHGSNRHFRIGNDAITSQTLDGYSDELKKIVPHLNLKGLVVLEACHAGEAVRLMGLFSKVLGGIQVVGREGLQSPWTEPTGTPTKVQDADGFGQTSNIG
jgi:hypothetical protein